MVEIERLLQEDIRHKKQAGRGVFHRSKGSGRVGKSSMIFPSDIVRDRKYQKNGKLEVFNVYENIIPYNEFKKYSPEDQKSMLEHWRKKYTNVEIGRNLGISPQRVSQLCTELGVQLKIKRKKENLEVVAVEAMTTQQTNIKNSMEGIKLTMNGDYNGKDLEKRLLALAAVLAVADTTFKVSLSIEENNDKEDVQ